MTKEFISRKTAGNFQKPTSQFAPRPFATPQQKSAKTENSTLQDIQCSPESSDRLSRIAITQPEPFTPQLTVQRAEQAQVANENPGEEAEKIQRSSNGNNRLEKISIQLPEPPSTPKFPIQAKLTVGAAGDKYEQEADRVARQVVNRIQAPQVNFNSSESNPVQRKISIQAFGGEGGDVSSEWESELNRARGGGQPLSPSLKESMEREFGADFSGVRVHTGAQADMLAKSIQAKAFTTGQDVFFRKGAYEPGSRGGQELIAHELTHVVQQNKRKQEKKAGEEIKRIIDNQKTTNYYKEDQSGIKKLGKEPKKTPDGYAEESYARKFSFESNAEANEWLIDQTVCEKQDETKSPKYGAIIIRNNLPQMPVSCIETTQYFVQQIDDNASTQQSLPSFDKADYNKEHVWAEFGDTVSV